MGVGDAHMQGLQVSLPTSQPPLPLLHVATYLSFEIRVSLFGARRWTRESLLHVSRPRVVVVVVVVSVVLVVHGAIARGRRVYQVDLM
jgi:hypothetical protein